MKSQLNCNDGIERVEGNKLLFENANHDLNETNIHENT